MTQAADAAGELLSPGAWVAYSTPSGIKFGVVAEVHEQSYRSIPVTVLGAHKFQDRDAWRASGYAGVIPLKPPVVKKLKLHTLERVLVIKRTMVPQDERRVLEEACAERMKGVVLWERV